LSSVGFEDHIVEIGLALVEALVNPSPMRPILQFPVVLALQKLAVRPRSYLFDPDDENVRQITPEI
jgi:hypothetical protein